MAGFADPSIYSTGTRIVAPRPRTHAQQVTRPDPPALLAGCCSILAFDPSNSSHLGIRGHLRMLPPQLLYTSSYPRFGETYRWSQAPSHLDHKERPCPSESLQGPQPQTCGRVLGAARFL